MIQTLHHKTILKYLRRSAEAKILIGNVKQADRNFPGELFLCQEKMFLLYLSHSTKYLKRF